MQIVPISVLPAAPMRVTLLPGHPFHVGDIPAPDALASQPTAAAIPISAGAPVPPCRVAVHDFWGNVCVPSQRLTWKVTISSTGFAASTAEFSPDLLGVATVQGLVGARSAPKDVDGACAVHFEVMPVAGLGMEAAANEATEVPPSCLCCLCASLYVAGWCEWHRACGRAQVVPSASRAVLTRPALVVHRVTCRHQLDGAIVDRQLHCLRSPRSLPRLSTARRHCHLPPLPEVGRHSRAHGMCMACSL